MTPAEVLQEFYADWHMWATLGAGRHAVFRPNIALCESLVLWSQKRRRTIVETPSFAALDMLQMRLFINAGLDVAYPFSVNRAYWLSEAMMRQMHLNPGRLAWTARLSQGIPS